MARLDRSVLDHDLYELLGVRRDATPLEIRRAHRRVVAASHPDRHPNDATSASRRTALVNVAAGVLLDPQLRRTYDQLRELRERRARRSTRPEAQPGWVGRSSGRGPDDWVAPAPPPRRGDAPLFAALRTWPERQLEAFGAWHSALSSRSHAAMFAFTLMFSFLLIGAARPKPLFAPEKRAKTVAAEPATKAAAAPSG